LKDSLQVMSLYIHVIDGEGEMLRA